MIKKPTNKLSFKPIVVVRALLAPLQERSRDVMERRFGLTGKTGEKMTLEAIGEIYGITRERVRQIENFAVEAIRKSDSYTKAKVAFDEFEDLMIGYGGLVGEEIFLNELAEEEVVKNQIAFLLAIGESFIRIKEDDNFEHRWTVDNERAEGVHSALHRLHKSVGPEELIAEVEMIERFVEHLKKELADFTDKDHARKWLELSKHIDSNPLNEWGLADSPNVRTRGVRDYAYLVLRNHGKPLHFTQVAKMVEEMFDKPAHVATTHNELIKDDRFVLVGRGLYALTEWGYTNGVVRDVIKKVIKERGPLTKEDVIKEVLKQRQVKENTIYVNLQNSHYFHKDAKSRYTLAS